MKQILSLLVYTLHKLTLKLLTAFNSKFDYKASISSLRLKFQGIESHHSIAII